MHLLLSFRKDSSFFCRDARIDTRELQYRNRTLSVRVMCIKFCNFHAYKTQFEELAEQFIPSDPTWRGWMRIALHQPLVPVFPVARELFYSAVMLKGLTGPPPALPLPPMNS